MYSQPSVSLRYMPLFLKEKLLQQFFIECHKTKTKPVTYQLDYSANLKRQIQNKRNCLIALDT